MWPAENIMQSMWPAVLCWFPTPVLKDTLGWKRIGPVAIVLIASCLFFQSKADCILAVVVTAITSYIFSRTKFMFCNHNKTSSGLILNVSFRLHYCRFPPALRVTNQ